MYNQGHRSQKTQRLRYVKTSEIIELGREFIFRRALYKWSSLERSLGWTWGEARARYIRYFHKCCLPTYQLYHSMNGSEIGTTIDSVNDVHPMENVVVDRDIRLISKEKVVSFFFFFLIHCECIFDTIWWYLGFLDLDLDLDIYLLTKFI